MKSERIDMVVKRIGRYSVLEFAYVKDGRAYWKCECDCGTIKNIRGTSLRNGNTKSCGCLNREISSKVNSGKNHPMFGKKRPGHSKKMKGKNHPRYNFSMTDEERQVRRTYTKYREWRTAVFERDDYICQCCNTKKGPFNAHHLDGYDKFRDLRVTLVNGTTLCENCHIDFHYQYGKGGNTRGQFGEFKRRWRMILEKIDFTGFYIDISGIFNNYFDLFAEVGQLMEYVKILADANFKCYVANMLVIKERKKKFPSDKLIADMEWVARSVGEYRVSSKARINKYIAGIRPKTVQSPMTYWADDDVVYSVGEMMDRLSIEFIKREDFFKNNRAKHMTESSQNLSDRVTKYLHYKLSGLRDKGYECVHEQRTYDLEGIVKDLAI